MGLKWGNYFPITATNIVPQLAIVRTKIDLVLRQRLPDYLVSIGEELVLWYCHWQIYDVNRTSVDTRWCIMFHRDLINIINMFYKYSRENRGATYRLSCTSLRWMSRSVSTYSRPLGSPFSFSRHSTDISMLFQLWDLMPALIAEIANRTIDI